MEKSLNFGSFDIHVNMTALCVNLKVAVVI